MKLFDEIPVIENEVITLKRLTYNDISLLENMAMKKRHNKWKSRAVDVYCEDNKKTV